MDQYEILFRAFPGWGFQDVRALSPRERVNWLARAQRR